MIVRDKPAERAAGFPQPRRRSAGERAAPARDRAGQEPVGRHLGAAPAAPIRAPAPRRRPRRPGPRITGPSSRAPSTDLRPLADQHPAAELDPVAERAAGLGVDDLARGLDPDRPGEHVEVALQVLGERADVVPVGVGDVDAERDVVRRAAPGTRRARSRPRRWSGK